MVWASPGLATKAFMVCSSAVEPADHEPAAKPSLPDRADDVDRASDLGRRRRSRRHRWTKDSLGRARRCGICPMWGGRLTSTVVGEEEPDQPAPHRQETSHEYAEHHPQP